MSVSYRVETYDEIIGELESLLPKHWEELAVYKDIPLAPDFALYKQVAKAGRLLICTARAHDGALIGYSIFALHPTHPHYMGLSWAANDIVWVRPDQRKNGVGRALRDFWDRKLFEAGITLVVIDTKVSHPELMYLLKGGEYVTRSCGMEKRLR